MTQDYYSTPESPRTNYGNESAGSTNRTLIIVIVILAILVFCCCCAFLAFMWFYGGDLLVELLGLNSLSVLLCMIP
jgi:hypothetical protein